MLNENLENLLHCYKTFAFILPKPNNAHKNAGHHLKERIRLFWCYCIEYNLGFPSFTTRRLFLSWHLIKSFTLVYRNNHILLKDKVRNQWAPRKVVRFRKDEMTNKDGEKHWKLISQIQISNRCWCSIIFIGKSNVYKTAQKTTFFIKLTVLRKTHINKLASVLAK